MMLVLAMMIVLKIGGMRISPIFNEYEKNLHNNKKLYK